MTGWKMLTFPNRNVIIIIVGPIPELESRACGGFEAARSPMQGRPHVPGYTGFLPNDCDNPDIEPPGASPRAQRVTASRVGFRPHPGDNPVKLGMDKIRAFRSVQGYKGHVPNHDSPLRKGNGRDAVSIDILAAIASLLDNRVPVPTICRALDLNGSGKCDKAKVLEGMNILRFNRVSPADVAELWDSKQVPVDYNGDMMLQDIIERAYDKKHAMSLQGITFFFFIFYIGSGNNFFRKFSL